MIEWAKDFLAVLLLCGLFYVGTIAAYIFGG